MKKLPIGISSLGKIIQEDLLYVDKTDIAWKLINTGSYYFLSRPRRFGKSLFLDTLKEIFEGNKPLFKGLFIEDKWNFDERFPVIRISFGAGVHKNLDDLQRGIRWILKRNEEDLGVQCTDGTTPRECFEELIRKAQQKYRRNVVILVDEYDKPILDNITTADTAAALRDELKNFYSVIKDNDAFIRFVFITGVSKFSKMNLFSGLNNLNDITIDERYGNICGYTHRDLETVFAEHLQSVDMEAVKCWYNGYYYFQDKLYNPFDILLFIDKGFEFRNYWWSTGNPAFLLELLQQKPYFIPELQQPEATDELLDSFDVDNIPLVPLLWQTGYLTFKSKVQQPFGVFYTLGIPNREIQTSLNSLFATWLTQQTTEKISIQHKISQALLNADLNRLQQELTTLFASIPYQNFTNNSIAQYEGYYASVVYAYLASLGFDIIPEDTTHKGSIDLALKTARSAFIFEFKVTDKPSGNALQQIKQKKYHEKYLALPAVYLIGIEFGRNERNITRFDWEKLPAYDIPE